MERRRRARRPLTPDQLLGIANYLTYSRIALVPLIVFFVMQIQDFDWSRDADNRLFSFLATGFFTVAQLSDVVDGYYARKYGVMSSFGKFLDPLADKLLSVSVLVMLTALQRVDAWIVVLLISREMTITAVRSMAAAEGIEIAASNWGKRKTFLQSFALGALLVHYPMWGFDFHKVGEVLLWLTLLVSVGSGVHYIVSFFGEIWHKKKGG